MIIFYNKGYAGMKRISRKPSRLPMDLPLSLCYPRPNYQESSLVLQQNTSCSFPPCCPGLLWIPQNTLPALPTPAFHSFPPHLCVQAPNPSRHPLLNHRPGLPDDQLGFGGLVCVCVIFCKGHVNMNRISGPSMLLWDLLHHLPATPNPVLRVTPIPLSLQTEHQLQLPLPSLSTPPVDPSDCLSPGFSLSTLQHQQTLPLNTPAMQARKTDKAQPEHCWKIQRGNKNTPTTRITCSSARLLLFFFPRFSVLSCYN